MDNTEIISSDDSNSPNTKDLSKRVVEDLGCVLSSGEFSDFEIVTPTKTFNAHSFILKVRSPYFRALFENNWKEHTEGKISVSHSSDVVSVVLKFMYTGKISGIPTIASDVLGLAAEWFLKDLKDVAIHKCLKIIQHFDTNHIIDVKETIKILKSAHLHDAKPLEDAVMEYIQRNVKEFKKSGEWVAFKRDPNYTVVFTNHFEEGSPAKRNKLG